MSFEVKGGNGSISDFIFMNSIESGLLAIKESDTEIKIFETKLIKVVIGADGKATRTQITIPEQIVTVPDLVSIPVKDFFTDETGTITFQVAGNAYDNRTLWLLGRVQSFGGTVNNLIGLGRIETNNIQAILMDLLRFLPKDGRLFLDLPISGQADLGLTFGTGLAFAFAGMRLTSPTNANIFDFTSKSNQNMLFFLRTGTQYDASTDIHHSIDNTLKYDLNGVLTNVEANKFVRYRFYITPITGDLYTILVQVGQVTYSTFAQAQTQSPSESFIENSIAMENGLLVCEAIFGQATTQTNDIGVTTEFKNNLSSFVAGLGSSGGSSNDATSIRGKVIENATPLINELLIFNDVTDEWEFKKIDTQNIENLAIAEAQLDNIAVTSIKLRDNAVIQSKIASNAVTASKIQDGQIINSKIADNAVGTSKIENNAIETAKILDAQITAAKIANGAVDDEALAANAVITSKIIDGAITAAKLEDGVITSDSNQITASQIFTPGGGSAVMAGMTVTLPNNNRHSLIKVKFLINATVVQGDARMNITTLEDGVGLNTELVQIINTVDGDVAFRVNLSNVIILPNNGQVITLSAVNFGISGTDATLQFLASQTFIEFIEIL